MGTDKKIKVCHLISGDLWAGSEVQMHILLVSLKTEPQLDISAIVLNNGKLVTKLRDAGLEVLVIEETKYSFFQILSLIKEELKDKNIDISHTHRYKENILGAYLKKNGTVRHLVQTVHGLGEPFRGVKLLKARLYSFLNLYFTRKYFDKVQTVSYDIQDKLKSKINPDQLVTVHNSINTADIRISRTASEVRGELGINENQAVIGSAGRMVQIKRYDVLLKTAQIIIDRMPGTIFILAGDGPLKSALENQAREMGIENKVLFLGYRDDIAEIVSCLDVYLISSQHEGIPMSLLEAMALRKAIVSTRVGGVKEIVENNISGILVEAGDPSTLASACMNVLENPELKKRLEEAAGNRIDEAFSIEIQKQRMLKLYQEVVGIR